VPGSLPVSQFDATVQSPLAALVQLTDVIGIPHQAGQTRS